MVLLDTCSLLWLTSKQEMFSASAKSALKNADSVFISAISAFEIGLKCKKGLLVLPLPPELWLKQALELHGIDSLSVDCEIALCATQLPELHKDPADRIIIATALIHELKIITPDQHIQAYPQTKFIW